MKTNAFWCSSNQGWSWAAFKLLWDEINHVLPASYQLNGRLSGNNLVWRNR